MYLLISKCVTAVKVSNFSGHYLRNRSTLDIGVLDYIGIGQHKENSSEVLSIPPGTPCIKPTWYKIFLSMFISFLYTFRPTMCLSSGGTTVFMRHLVLVILCG